MTAFARDRATILFGFAACCAAVTLYGYAIFRGQLSQDDFQILAQSFTWRQTWDGLWIPNNEHAMPLGRLLTFAVIQLAGRPANYHWLTSLVGPAALVAAMCMLYRFVQRELGHPFYGLVAMILFGVTAVYQQAVFWFAASFSVLALDMLLLGLLAAQSFRRTSRWPYLLLSAGWCCLSPCWFAIGVLAGPVCALYLLLSEPRPSGSGSRFRSLTVAALKNTFLAAVPLLGTAAFLAVSLPRTWKTIVNLPHYQSQGTDAIQAFQPGKGFLISLRSVVENLLLGVIGVWEIPVPTPLVVVAWLGLVVFGVWWWRRAPCKRLLLLGIGILGPSYLLVYSARAIWPTDTTLVGVAWSRYHLLPHLGLTLFFLGGLPSWQGRTFVLAEDGSLTHGQKRFLAALLGILLLMQLPHGIIGSIPYAGRIIMPEEQQKTLNRIEMVDIRCQKYGIGADAARRALPPLSLPESRVNGWEFLRGSQTPRDPETRSDEEIRRLLEE